MITALLTATAWISSLNVYDKALARRLTQVFDSDLKQAVEQSFAAWQKRPFGERLKEKMAALIKSQL